MSDFLSYLVGNLESSQKLFMYKSKLMHIPCVNFIPRRNHLARRQMQNLAIKKDLFLQDPAKVLQDPARFKAFPARISLAIKRTFSGIILQDLAG